GLAGRPGQGPVRAEPGDVDAAVLAQGKVSAADVARRHGAAGLAVDPDGVLEVSAVLRGGVEEVACARLALEVEQMHDTLAAHGDLRLDAVAGHPEQDRPGRLVRRLSERGD